MMFYDYKSFVYHLLVVDGGQRFQELTLSENG